MEKSTGNTPIFVIFGIPGSGKSTISERAATLLQSGSDETTIRPIGLDLDVCVPQWMRDNFASGIYPTLSQRDDFSVSICDYVDESLSNIAASESGSDKLVALVSFSFVNQDIRDNFRTRFPDSHWILVQTPEDEAQRRIVCRKGHFYKGKSVQEELVQPAKAELSNNADNSDWDFAPIPFSHTVLDGTDRIDVNAGRVVNLVRERGYQYTLLP